MKVYVYFNLHKRVWSVKALEGPAKGRVILHTDSLFLEDCVFKVSEAGRQRVIRERRKNVHAGVVGYMRHPQATTVACTRHVTYDPYKYANFVDALDQRPRHAAPFAQFKSGRVFVPEFLSSPS